MSTDAHCVQVYQVIRKDVPSSAVRLSEGRNLYRLPSELSTHLGDLMDGLLATDRFTQYESDADARDRSLAADLLEEYLGRPGITKDHVVFTNGSQEAISLICAFAAARKMSALFPLPLYYSYEQSSLRWSLPVAGYYGADGNVAWLEGTPAERLLQVMVLPNFVTGTIFPNPTIGSDSSHKDVLTVIDCVYQLGAYAGPCELTRATAAAVAQYRLDDLVLLFTASKDLSLPGLRAGVMITGNKELLAAARADRFERIYSINPLLGQVMASYFALLLLNQSRSISDAENNFERTYLKVRKAFSNAGVPLPSSADLSSICDSFDSMTGHCRNNLETLRRSSALQLDILPFAGYSVFPKLNRDFETPAEFLEWVNHAGREFGLKLNPAYLFGGSPEVWNQLYPHEKRIRVNVSYPQTDLEIGLQRLENAVQGSAKSGRQAVFQ